MPHPPAGAHAPVRPGLITAAPRGSPPAGAGALTGAGQVMDAAGSALALESVGLLSKALAIVMLWYLTNKARFPSPELLWSACCDPAQPEFHLTEPNGRDRGPVSPSPQVRLRTCLDSEWVASG